jgi:hypothetical protein
MATGKRRFIVVVMAAALGVAALPGAALAATDLHVCTWHTQAVGDAVGDISAAPDAVLGPNNGGLPGGDKGPYPIYFETTQALSLATSSGSGACA